MFQSKQNYVSFILHINSWFQLHLKCLETFFRCPLQHGGRVLLTRLFDHKQDGFAAGVLVVLEMLHAVVFVFIRAVYRVRVMENCVERVEEKVSLCQCF